MAELKTKPTDNDVLKFLHSVPDEQKRKDCFELLELMKKVSDEDPKMWGAAIIGFGSYHYKYESGREGDWFLTGFSPRKQNISLYIMPGFDRYDELMNRLGKYKTGKSCLYISQLNQIKLDVLEELIRKSVDYMKKKYKERN